VQLPEPHPDPPTNLHQSGLPLYEAHGPWIRSHPRRYQPLHFGNTGFNRFDAPGGQYRILYVAADVHGAFIETFGRQLGERRLEAAHVASRALSQVTHGHPLQLVDLTGPGLSQIGADTRLTAANYDLSQRWALALHEHPDQPDGLLYRSRHDPSRLCAAIFDRAASALTATPLGSLADSSNAALLADLLDTYDYALIGP
jgi:RES domain-containing protein